MDAISTQIKLRALEPEDIDTLYKWENNPEIWKVSNTITPFSRHILTKYIESSHLDIYQTRQLRLMIDVYFENRIKTVGTIDLFDFDPYHQRAGVGILIGEDAERRKGYSGLALEEFKDYSFKVMKLNQVYCNILLSNVASMNLFQKHGFEVVGIKKQWIKTENGFADEAMLQCINPTSI